MNIQAELHYFLNSVELGLQYFSKALEARIRERMRSQNKIENVT